MNIKETTGNYVYIEHIYKSDTINVDVNILSCDIAMQLMRVMYKQSLYYYDEVNDLFVMRNSYLNEYEDLCMEIKDYLLREYSPLKSVEPNEYIYTESTGSHT